MKTALQSVAFGLVLLFLMGWVIDRVNAIEEIPLPLPAPLVESVSAGAAPPREPTEVNTPASVGEGPAASADSDPFGDRVVAFVRARAGEEAQLAREGIDERWFRELARLASDVTVGSRVDPALLVALAWRESRWRPDAVGQAHEIGLVQLKGQGVMLGYASDVVAASPSLNLWLGVRHLERSLEQCGGQLIPALFQYGMGRCSGPSDPQRREIALRSINHVLDWRREIAR